MSDIVLENDEFEAGQIVELENVNVYPRYCSSKTNIVKSGTFYIWNSSIKNNRIRITKNIKGSNVPGQVTGWVDINDLKQNNNQFNLGDEITVTGNINTYADGSGNIIYKENTIMYIVDLLDPDQFSHYIAVATAKNRTKIGWATAEMVIDKK